MANARRISVGLQPQPVSDSPSPPPPPLSSPSPSAAAAAAAVSSVAVFFKRPSAFPLLLSVFVLLTWVFLRLEHPAAAGLRSSLSSGLSSSSSRSGTGPVDGADSDANLVRFSAVEFPSKIARDWRGWLMDPVTAAREARLRGRASKCASVHVGQIQPGGLRGNHRHHTCNETFIIWGGDTKFRLENPNVKDKGYAEVTIRYDEVALATSPSGTAHAIINVDRVRSTFLLGCQDSLIKNNASTTDYNVWKDL